MGCPPWALDPELPVGGLYWIHRVRAFEECMHQAQLYRKSHELDK